MRAGHRHPLPDAGLPQGGREDPRAVTIAILNIDYSLSFLKGIVYTLGVSVGYTLAIVLFATARDRTFLAPVPRAFQGCPIAFITASLMSLAFMGFAHLFGL